MALRKSRRTYTLRSVTWSKSTFIRSCAVFEHTDGGRLEIDHDSFDEMGRPQCVTVTIEPGDHLNGG